MSILNYRQLNEKYETIVKGYVSADVLPIIQYMDRLMANAIVPDKPTII